MIIIFLLSLFLFVAPATAMSELEKNLFDAARSGNVDRVRDALDRGTDLEIYDKHGRAPLHYAAIRDHVAIAQLLLDHGAHVNIENRNEDQSGWTSLHYAARSDNHEIVHLLLRHGADVNRPKDDGWTPLHLAASNNHLETVKLLLANNANVYLANNAKETAYDLAQRWGYEEVCSLLKNAQRYNKIKGIPT